MTTDFASLPDHARLWVYATREPLAPDAAQALARALSDFTDGWTSHGRAVHAASDVRDARLVLLAGYVPNADQVSGCGIDASVHAVEDAATGLHLELAQALDVVYRMDDGMVDVLPRAAFKHRSRDGDVDARTTVFDLTATTVGDLREGRLERPAGESWHARLLTSTSNA